jgi:hypothetical protein
LPETGEQRYAIPVGDPWRYVGEETIFQDRASVGALDLDLGPDPPKQSPVQEVISDGIRDIEELPGDDDDNENVIISLAPLGKKALKSSQTGVVKVDKDMVKEIYPEAAKRQRTLPPAQSFDLTEPEGPKKVYVEFHIVTPLSFDMKEQLDLLRSTTNIGFGSDIYEETDTDDLGDPNFVGRGSASSGLTGAGTEADWASSSLTGASLAPQRVGPPEAAPTPRMEMPCMPISMEDETPRHQPDEEDAEGFDSTTFDTQAEQDLEEEEAIQAKSQEVSPHELDRPREGGVLGLGMGMRSTSYTSGSIDGSAGRSFRRIANRKRGNQKSRG